MAKVSEKDVKTKKTSKPKTTKKVEKQKKERLLTGVRKEVKLIKWPEKKDIFKYTIATIIFCVVVAVFFVLLTYLLSIVKGV